MDGIKVLEDFLQRYSLCIKDFSFIGFSVDKNLFNLYSKHKTNKTFENFKRKLAKTDMKPVNIHTSDFFSFVSYETEINDYKFVVYIEKWRIGRWNLGGRFFKS